MSARYGDEERASLLATARESIRARLEGRHPRWPELALSLVEPRGAFVSLHIEGRLRGCIGRMQSADPLVETVKRMAISAAFEDPRFNPLERGELGLVDIEISVLTPFEPCRPEDVVPGIHGVYLVKDGRSGVFLPQVAPEQGWGRDELLRNLCLKAGLAPGSHLSPDARLFLFAAEVFGERELDS